MHISHSGSSAILFVLVLLCAVACVSFADRTETTLVHLGSNYARTRFEIDQIMNVEGVQTHFFTSPRQQTDYLGFYLNTTREFTVNKHFGYGGRVGMGWWQAGYILNWEMPEYGTSLEPIKSTIASAYFEFGSLFFCRAGPLKISPCLTIPVGLSEYDITVGGEGEGGVVVYSGLNAGLETGLFLGNSFGLVLGYQRLLMLRFATRYKLEEGIRLRGRFSDMPEVIYFGIAAKGRL